MFKYALTALLLTVPAGLFAVSNTQSPACNCATKCDCCGCCVTGVCTCKKCSCACCANQTAAKQRNRLLQKEGVIA